MRIGIITLGGANNYGSKLQAYALQTVLRNQGHSSVVLPVQYNKKNKGALKVLESPVRFLFEAIKEKKFAPFCARHFQSSGIEPSRVSDFLKSDSGFDAYICGSDQIWNPGVWLDDELRALFFLDFGAPSAKRIAYAASWGAKSVSAEARDVLKACLSKFNAISVREESGVGIVNGLGFPATWVPDPTLLLEVESWNALAKSRDRSQEGETLFQCEYRWTPCVPFSKVRDLLVRKHGWKTVIPFSDHPFRDAAHTRCLTPEEWLGAIQQSAFVLTNSFHSMVFSIIFQRPFISIPLEGKYAGMNERIFSLAERLGLGDRVLSSYDESRILALAETPIRWDEVSQKLEAWKKEAFSFLDQALQ